MPESMRQCGGVFLAILLLAGVIGPSGCGNKGADVVIYGVEYVLVQSNDPMHKVFMENSMRGDGYGEDQIKDFMSQIDFGSPEDWRIWYFGYIKNRGTKDALDVRYRFDAPAGTIRSPPKLTLDQLVQYSLGPKPWDVFESVTDDGSFGSGYLKAGEMKRVSGMLAAGRFKNKSPQEIYQRILTGIQARIE